MESSDDLFENKDAKQALIELFPEEADELRKKHNAEVMGMVEEILPKLLDFIEEREQEMLTAVQEMGDAFSSHSEESDQKHDELESKITEVSGRFSEFKKIEQSIGRLRDSLSETRSDLAGSITTAVSAAKEVSYRALGRINELSDALPDLKERIESAHKKINAIPEPYDDKEVRGDIKEINNRLNNLPRGGGNMNRNIWIGGNSSVLSRYTDINLKAGANVTLSYLNNDTLKTTDITVAATGGAGSTRSINSISTSQTAGSTAGTDYVYICSAGINVTLPTAVGNTNLYTVKNTSSSSVVVTTTSSQTIDGQGNIILATQYTAVDLISDSANWDIT